MNKYYVGIRDKFGEYIRENDIVYHDKKKWIVYYEPRLASFRLYPLWLLNEFKGNAISLGWGKRMNYMKNYVVTGRMEEMVK